MVSPSDLDQIHGRVALAFSIIGLALVVPILYLFKQYFRFLDHCQLVFLYWVTLASNKSIFAKHLDDTWTLFFPNFFKNECQLGEMMCVVGESISFTVCIVALGLIIFTAVAIQKFRENPFHAQPAYDLLKGLFKWTYLALAYNSLYYFFSDFKNSQDVNLAPATIIAIWSIAFPILLLFSSKIHQGHETYKWIKWLEFLDYVRLFSIAFLLQFAFTYADEGGEAARYFVFIPLIGHPIMFLWKKNFTYEKAERAVHAVGELFAVIIYLLFLIDTQRLVESEFDLWGLAVILFLDMMYYGFRLVSMCKYGNTNADKHNPREVNPNPEVDDTVHVQIDNKGRLTVAEKDQDKFNNSSDVLSINKSKDEVQLGILKGTHN